MSLGPASTRARLPDKLSQLSKVATSGSSQPDLAALLAAVATGDREAFTRLYGLTAAKLLGVALRILRDRQAAEDVVQDAFIRVWRSSGSYSPDAGRPMTWLITIVRHRAIDLVRQRSDLVRPIGDEGAGAVLHLPDPVDHEAAFLDADRLSGCLARLDAVQRECFVLAYLDGLSRDELAERFGRPVNTIKTWLHRSARALRLCLGTS